MELLYYVERKRSEYNRKKFERICKCAEQCETAIDILDPHMDITSDSVQDVLFTLCHARATDYAYGLLKLVRVLKHSPRATTKLQADGRKLNRKWTKSEERDLIELFNSGVKHGDYRIFGERYGKTRVAVKEKVRNLKKEGRIDGNIKGGLCDLSTRHLEK